MPLQKRLVWRIEIAQPFAARSQNRSGAAGRSPKRRPSRVQISSSIQWLKRFTFHNVLDSFSQFRAGHARHTYRWRRGIEAADVQNGFGVGFRIGSQAYDFLHRRHVPARHKPNTNPPDQRMKPEHGFDDHVYGRRQIVSPGTWHSSWARTASSWLDVSRVWISAGSIRTGQNPTTPGSTRAATETARDRGVQRQRNSRSNDLPHASPFAHPEEHDGCGSGNPECECDEFCNACAAERRTSLSPQKRLFHRVGG